MALIKNIPAMAFGLHGNRGIGFPIKGHVVQDLVSPFQTSNDCILEKDQDFISILSENNSEILVICNDIVSEIPQPNIDCTLATQEDVSIPILQQEGDPFIVDCDK